VHLLVKVQSNKRCTVQGIEIPNRIFFDQFLQKFPNLLYVNHFYSILSILGYW